MRSHIERIVYRPPTGRPDALALVLASLALASCGDVPTATQPGPQQPVIQIILTTAATEQVAAVFYTARADTVVPFVPVPVAAESVALAIRTSGGNEVPLTSIPGAPGRFRARMSILPGATYQLVGSAADHPVAARTTVPQALRIREPSDDTLRMSRAAYEQGGTLEDVPYDWSAAGAAGYLVQITSTESPIGGSRLLEDTSGVLLAVTDLLPGRPETSLLEVFALDSAATAFFRPRSTTVPRPGNIAGALGFFGSAVVSDPKVVLWQ